MSPEEVKLLHLVSEDFTTSPILVATGVDDELPQEFQALGIGQRFFDILKAALKSIDIKALTKDQFLGVVSTAFDTLVAPMFSGPMALIVPLLKSVVMSLAEQYYDRLVTGS